MECIKEVSKYPTCICSSGFVFVTRETDEGREKVCHKRCENSNQCKSDEVCNEDPEVGIFCVASADMEACDETIRCQAPETCDLVGSSPKCKCPNNKLLIEMETSGAPARQCLKICETSSHCEMSEVCKDLEFGIVCVASTDLEACDETIRCEHPEACGLVDDSPKCKCPFFELLIVTETSGTPERRCLKSCSTTDNCEAGTLCFEDSILTQTYCEDRDRIPDCSAAVKCTSNTECGLTIDHTTECLCANEHESTVIESTESGSTRTCPSSCGDSNGCPLTELCLSDTYSKQGYCQVKGNKCPDEVRCPDFTGCKLNSDGFAECLCECGSTEIEANGPHATTRTCHTRTCTDSNGCRKRELCYRNEISKELYCDDRTKGCDGAVCPDKFECLDTLKGYSECFCSKGYTETIEFNTDNVRTNPRICEEQTCTTSNDCNEKYLCYFDSALDQFGFCSTRLKECDGVRCPSEQDNCRVASSGYVDCLCDEDEYTSVDAEGTGGTMRACHLLTCATSNDCDGTSLCYLDSITEDFFCDDTPTVCTSEIVCPEGFHCDDSGVRPQCVCDDDEETQRIQTTRIMTMIDGDGRSVSERFCHRSCADSNDCFPGTICYTDATFIGYGCYEDRSPEELKCSRVLCSPLTECRNEHVVADCLCKNMAATIIEPTHSGSRRDCDPTIRTCLTQGYCIAPGADECLLDPHSLQGHCVDSSGLDSCQYVLCGANSFCLDTMFKCGCEADESIYHTRCWTTCDTDKYCDDKGLGLCDKDGLCALVRE